MSPLVVRGDSMVSGFPTTRDIPDNCLCWDPPINREPLVSLGEAITRRAPDTIVCALPGIASAGIVEWFDLTPIWWGHPTVFWFGRCEKPLRPEPIIAALEHMTPKLTAPWIVCAITMTLNEQMQARTEPVIRTNQKLRAYAGERFYDPIRAVGGDHLLPVWMRVDTMHPNNSGAKAIARSLLKTMRLR
jgi:hypothetical protein